MPRKFARRRSDLSFSPSVFKVQAEVYCFIGPRSTETQADAVTLPSVHLSSKYSVKSTVSSDHAPQRRRQTQWPCLRSTCLQSTVWSLLFHRTTLHTAVWTCYAHISLLYMLYYFCTHILVLYIVLLSILSPTVVFGIQVIGLCPITFPQSTLPPTDAGVMPLDNLCLTDINSPSSKCNAKPQSHKAQLWLVNNQCWSMKIAMI